MNFLNLFKSKNASLCTKNARDRALIARYAQGNVPLQKGIFSTKKDIEKRKSRVLKYKFSE